jgi:hypothetical protein
MASLRDRIEKLRRLAESPNKHEAESARAEVARLLKLGGGADPVVADPGLVYLGTVGGVRQFRQQTANAPSPSGQLPFARRHPKPIGG